MELSKFIMQIRNNIICKNEFKTIGGEYSTTINNINENIDYIIIIYEIKNIIYQK